MRVPSTSQAANQPCKRDHVTFQRQGLSCASSAPEGCSGFLNSFNVEKTLRCQVLSVLILTSQEDKCPGPTSTEIGLHNIQRQDNKTKKQFNTQNKMHLIKVLQLNLLYITEKPRTLDKEKCKNLQITLKIQGNTYGLKS